MRIIIADDEPIIVKTLSNFLRKSGHEVFETHDAHEAMCVVEQEVGEIDVLVSDIRMPRKDGVSLLQNVRARFPHINVVLMTGYENILSTSEALERGACAYLRKPVKLVELEALLAQIEQYRSAAKDVRRLSEAVDNEKRLREEFARDNRFLLRLHTRMVPKDFSWMHHTEACLRHLPLSGLGGDFVDLRPYGPGRALILVADVSGHGLPAAFGGITLRTALATLPSNLSPAQILRRLESALWETLSDEFFTTAFCGVYDEEDRRLRYSIAGHPAPVVFSPREGARVLKGDGRALCCGDCTEGHEVHETHLSQTDTLLAYTDGLSRDALPLLSYAQESEPDTPLSVLMPDHLARRLLDAAVESQPGQAFADDLSLLILRPSAPRPGTDSATVSGKKVLVYDDDEDVRDFLSIVLESHGAVVAARDRADDCLRDVEDESPDAIITDVMMPGTTGLELLEQVRKHHPTLPVVIISGYDREQTVRGCLEKNACGFLRKPFQVEELVRVLENALALPAEQERIDFDDVCLDWMDFVIHSSPQALEILERYLASLERQAIPPAVLDDLLYCIREIAGNAIEWGNRHHDDKKVRISTVVLPDRVMVKVTDEGAGFDVRRVLDSDIDPEEQDLRDREGKRAGGFGLAIVRTKMDQLVFNRKGNVALMTKYFHSAQTGKDRSTRTGSGEFAVVTD